MSRQVSQQLAESRRRKRNNLLTALSFLAPNFIGFLVFVSFPLVFSLVLAFTNWGIDPRVPLKFVGFDNFRDIFTDAKFWSYFINTAYFMVGIPVGIGASLLLAMVLSQPIDIRSWRSRWLLAGIVVVMSASIWVVGRLTFARPEGTSALVGGMPGWVVLLSALTLSIGLLAVFGGAVAFRTLFYVPSVTQGVAMMLLWKALYRKEGGPINAGLVPVVDGLRDVAKVVPGWVFYVAAALCVGLVALPVVRLIRRMGRGDFSGSEVAAVLVITGAVVAIAMTGTAVVLWPVMIPGAVVLAAGLCGAGKFVFNVRMPPASDSYAAGVGTVGLAALLAGVLAVGLVAWAGLPGGTFAGVDWLGSTRNLLGYRVLGQDFTISWPSFGVGAHEAIILMGLWAGLGGSTTLLYLAGLSNIPQDLYEAADIDGAGKWAKFWHVTWPQLAPTTFFIVVMAGIGGLQGGFEQARVLTQGGPAETTTTLAYYINTKAFEEFQLGYAAAVSWFLFAVIFVLTLINWRFGNKAVND